MSEGRPGPARGQSTHTTISMHPATAKTTIQPWHAHPRRQMRLETTCLKPLVSLFCFCFFNSTNFFFLQDYVYDGHNDHRHYHHHHPCSTQWECKSLETCCLKPPVSFLFLFFYFTLLTFFKGLLIWWQCKRLEMCLCLEPLVSFFPPLFHYTQPCHNRLGPQCRWQHEWNQGVREGQGTWITLQIFN